MNSVSCDLSNGEIGPISKNYNQEHYQSFSITDILNDYWDLVIERINKEHNYGLVQF